MVKVNWNEAPEWAKYYGIVGINSRYVWYNDVNYAYIDEPNDMYSFGEALNIARNDIAFVRDRPVVSDKVSSTVEERGKRYGKFKDGARIMQGLKAAMKLAPNWHLLSPSQREALEMIQHKIGRILNGDPNYVDNWHDIQGFAMLVEEELNDEK